MESRNFKPSITYNFIIIFYFFSLADEQKNTSYYHTLASVHVHYIL